MKKYLGIALMFTLFFTIISCQKELSNESVTGGGGTGGTGAFRMKIDGVQWVADKQAGAAIMNGLINITGISASKKSFVITLSGTSTGTYILDPNSFNVAALTDSTENPFVYASNQGADTSESGGKVVVTKIDTVKKTISGTFSAKLFRALDSKRKIITEGVFENISYSTSLPPANSTDTFRVKIDGADWVPSSITAVSVAVTNQLAVVANNSTATKTVGLTMPLGVTAGSYTLDFFGGQYIGQYNPNSSTFLASETGTLTIIEHNATTKRIRGNFNFKAKALLTTDSAQLTAGYFSVKYQ